MLSPYTIVYEEKGIVARTLQDFLQRCMDFSMVYKKHKDFS